MIDIVEQLRFDATRCEVGFSRGVASNIEAGAAEIERLREALRSITLLGAKKDLPDAWVIAHEALGDGDNQQTVDDPEHPNTCTCETCRAWGA